ncbi:cysteine-rich PDZ-binding protein isoform X1 [Lissotriton helveticus]
MVCDKCAAEAETTDSEALHIEETPEETEGESHPAPQPGPSHTPAPVPPPPHADRATLAATEGVQPPQASRIAVEQAPPPPPRRQTRRTATVRSQASGRLRQQRNVATRADREQQAQDPGLGIERRMLAVYRKQAHHMAAIQLQLYKTARNVNQLTESVQELTASMKENSQLMVAQQDMTRHRQLLTRLSAYTRSNHLIVNATSQLSRRSLAMQIQMVQCCQDVARALEQVTTAVQNQQVCGHGHARGGDDASEGTSSLSSLSVLVVPERCRSTRPSAASRPDTADVDLERRQGASGRRRQ